MNRDWVRGGIALLCVAAVGGLVWAGLDHTGDTASLVKAISILVGIAGLLFIALGVYPNSRAPRD